MPLCRAKDFDRSDGKGRKGNETFSWRQDCIVPYPGMEAGFRELKTRGHEERGVSRAASESKEKS